MTAGTPFNKVVLYYTIVTNITNRLIQSRHLPPRRQVKSKWIRQAALMLETIYLNREGAPARLNNAFHGDQVAALQALTRVKSCVGVHVRDGRLLTIGELCSKQVFTPEPASSAQKSIRSGGPPAAECACRKDFLEHWKAYDHLLRHDRVDVLAAVKRVRQAAAMAASANVCQETDYLQALQHITGQLQECRYAQADGVVSGTAASQGLSTGHMGGVRPAEYANCYVTEHQAKCDRQVKALQVQPQAVIAGYA
ncbi:TPA: hypothetical protein ACH3X2_007019 [Trebouxia sp. C0005]